MVMGIGAIIGVILSCIVLIGGLFLIWWFMSMYQVIMQKKNNADQSLSELNALLKTRYQDISSFIDKCNKICDDEIKDKLIENRNSAMASTTTLEQFKNEANLDSIIEDVLASFSAKKDELTPSEREICEKMQKNQEFIARNRQFYNSVAQEYNHNLKSVPGKFWSSMRKLQPMPIFNFEN